MRRQTLTLRRGRRSRARAHVTRLVPPRLLPLLRAGRRTIRAGWHAVPLSVRRPVRDTLQKVMLRTGHGEVVPVQEYEQFLAAHLPKVKAPGGVYLGFGVYLGSSMAAAVRAFERVGCEDARFVGFDSFVGLPAGSEAEGWPTG